MAEKKLPAVGRAAGRPAKSGALQQSNAAPRLQVQNLNAPQEIEEPGSPRVRLDQTGSYFWAWIVSAGITLVNSVFCWCTSPL